MFGSRLIDMLAQDSSPRIARLPPAVRPGDRIAVAALSGPVDPARLDAGLAALRARYEVVEGANLRSRDGLFAGPDEARLDAFHALAADPSIRAVFFARGGYGVQRLLPRLDWDLLAAHPRAYVGYSDLTPFLLAVVERLGLVAFHGPMAAAEHAWGLGEAERGSLDRALVGEAQSIALAPGAPSSADAVSGADGAPCEGVLLGGCLSLLASSVGTPWTARLDGALLVLEDLEEPLYRLDRMLTQLRLSGSLERIHGVVFGHLTQDGRPCDTSWIPRLMADVGVPWAAGLPVGHARPNLTLPLGLPARLDLRTRRLEIAAEPTNEANAP